MLLLIHVYLLKNTALCCLLSSIKVFSSLHVIINISTEEYCFMLPSVIASLKVFSSLHVIINISTEEYCFMLPSVIASLKVSFRFEIQLSCGGYTQQQCLYFSAHFYCILHSAEVVHRSPKYS